MIACFSGKPEDDGCIEECNVDLRQKSVSARVYKLMFAEAERNGLDWRAVSASLNIDEATIRAKDARVSGDKHIRMLKLAATCFEAPPPIADMSLCLLPFPELAGVVFNCATLRDAMLRFVEYRGLIGNVDWLVTNEHDDAIAFDYLLEGEGRSSVCALGNFATIAAVARAYDPSLRIQEVTLTGPTGASATWLADSLGVRVRPDQLRNRMVLRSAVLDRPFDKYNSVLAAIHNHAAREDLGLILSRGLFSPNVQRCLRDVMSENVGEFRSKTLQAIVCERLSMTRWTLQRKLATEQLTFSDVLTQTRMQQARDLLAHTHMPISEISERVGFASTPAFTRFFSRACGIPPARFRDRHHHFEV
ncbi:helix-turn-helix transcriptional regulator [Paraburkholderia strydomiana]|uniref:helix-turn-helix transcriptional regulator n=1 Tax=Paraburkholderia strydomiana TaxID=1245417 RepID=UPI001BE6AB8B|nr:AraC family transcriptional regulator [Paraburkholderia strydomiana]MBT2793580.1 helix-turn-helix domain-containing protein [Paraburkholderia strydomiana]